MSLLVPYYFLLSVFPAIPMHIHYNENYLSLHVDWSVCQLKKQNILSDTLSCLAFISEPILLCPQFSMLSPRKTNVNDKC